MTIAKAFHLEARALLLKHLDLHPGKAVNDDLDPLEAGIVPDSSHHAGYHCGRSQVSDDDYSVRESSRDRKGLDDYSSGLDYGYFAVTTDRGTFDLYDYNAWLKMLWDAGDDDTKDLREVIYSPDGVHVKRLDKLGIRTTGDSSHQTHTHHSEFRDADGHRMVNLARRWLEHIGLLAGEDDDVSAKDLLQTDGFINNWSWRPDAKTNPKVTLSWAVWLAAQEAHTAAVDAKANRLTSEAILQAVKGVNDEAILARVGELAVQLAKLPDEVADAIVDADRPIPETVAALRAVLGDRAAEIGRQLAAAQA